MTYSEYKKRIRASIIELGRQGILVGDFPVRFLLVEGISPKDGGVIRARDPDLIFRDGARLKVYEESRIVNSKIERTFYSYHYERPNGYFFRYEREQSDDLLRKPEYHMHVILNLPHFVALPVNLETILSLIKVNFYSPNEYHKQIIGQEIHLAV